MEHPRINNKWPVAVEGLPFIAMSGLLTLILVLTALYYASVLAGLVFVFVACFFRDPERAPLSHSGGEVFSPADGKVLQVHQIGEEESPTGLSSVKISIFMSIFNVHVNRVPADATVEEITYYPGKFLSANLDKASKENERNEIAMRVSGAGKIVVTQIAGLIARRIVCWINKGDRVKAGQRFGLIRFGSRLEVYLPRDSSIAVQEGQKVRAGETVLAYLQG